MKLKITDSIWSVGSKTRKVKTVYAPLVVGPIAGIDGVSTWQIDAVGKAEVQVSIIRHDGTTIKTFTVQKGKGERWRPRSMDGGHIYSMKLVWFF